MILNISKHIYTVLTADPTVSGLIGDRIYPLGTKVETALPFVVYERNTVTPTYSKEYEQTTDDIFGLAYLLSVHPNPRLTAFEMMRNAVIQILLRGNAYIYPVEGADSYESLILLSPGSVAYDKFSDTYTVNDAVNRISGTFGSDRIIHLKNMSLDGGYTGVSTLAYAGKVLAISSNADSLNVDTYKNGGTVKGFVSGKNGSTIGFGTVQDNQLKQLSSSPSSPSV